VLEQADKNKNTNFDFDVYDTYSWYLKAGPLSTINAKYLHGTIPFWNDIIAHPNYDAFWKKEAWISKLHSSTVPNLNVAGFWDQEDPWGPWQIFRHASEHDPDHTSLMVAGPWYHGSWHTLKGDSIGIIPLGGHETAREFRENIEAPFFRYYLHDIGTKPAWRAMMFQTGSNRWRSYAAWPLPRSSTCTPTVGCRSRRHRPALAVARIASSSRIRRARCRTASVPSPRRIQPATGTGGKLPTSASSTGDPTCSPTRVPRSTTT
jgi:predicted acyl esterase